MDPQQVPFVSMDRLTLQRLLAEVKAFAASEVGGRAKGLFGLLIALLLAISAMNVIGSYVGRDFMTAIENRNKSGFIWEAVLWVGVFAVSTGIGALLRFNEERLGLLWREWLTQRLLSLYLDHGVYYRLSTTGEVANPDQRIAEDVRAFTATTLSFVLMILNSSITVLAFSGVLWAISPLLFVVSVLYAGGGSYISFILGRSLAGLNYTQLDKEANFRAELIHVRENAESVALLHREERLRARLLRRVQELVENFARIIVVNRNLNFYSIWYNYLVQIIPALVVAPLFISGEAPFGIIAQSAIAFVHLIGAFSLIVTNFPSLSTFTAVIARLGALREAMEHNGSAMACGCAAEGEAPTAAIEMCECADNGSVVFDELTLFAPQNHHPLVKDLSVTVPYGTRVLVSGSNEEAKLALFRATAGMWNAGAGRIVRPDAKQLYFLPERPYMPPGTLRDLLVRTGEEKAISEKQIVATLKSLRVHEVVERAGGLDAAQDWDEILSLGEQQLLAFCRLLIAAPRFAFLDRIRTALPPDDVNLVLQLLGEKSITYISLGRSRHGQRDSDDKLLHYDAVLELLDDGRWHWRPVKSGKLVEDEAAGARAWKERGAERRGSSRGRKGKG